MSPTTPRALAAGVGAACGVYRAEDEAVITALRQRYQAFDALLTDSGTSALILALRAFVRPEGTIAYPAYGCSDLVSAALQAPVRVRLYDLDPETLSPDIDSIRGVISRGVDAIVVTHLYGYPADVTAVQALAAEYGIPVIEDSAQGAGGTLRGARLGAIGDVSVLSFSRGKGTSSGSGGALLVRTTPLLKWARRVRGTLGGPPRGGNEVLTLAAQWIFGRPYLYGIPASIPALHLGEMLYRPPHEPRAMSKTAAAILPFALAMDDREIRVRLKRANQLLYWMSATPCLRPVRSVEGGESGYLRLAFLDAAGDRSSDPRLGALRGYPVTLDEQAQLRPILAAHERAGAGATTLRDRLFTVPTHSGVVEEDLTRVGSWLVARGPRPRTLQADVH